MLKVKPELLLIGAGQWILDWCEYYQIPYALIQKPEHFEPNTASETILVDYENDPKVWDYVEALCRSRDIAACLTSSESALAIAEQVTRSFDINYESCTDQKLLQDKYVMRALLAALGLNNVPYTLLHDEHQLQQFLQVQGDIVLKPRQGVASQNDQESINSIRRNGYQPPAFRCWLKNTSVARNFLSRYLAMTANIS